MLSKFSWNWLAMHTLGQVGKYDHYFIKLKIQCLQSLPPTGGEAVGILVPDLWEIHYGLITLSWSPGVLLGKSWGINSGVLPRSLRLVLPVSQLGPELLCWAADFTKLLLWIHPSKRVPMKARSQLSTQSRYAFSLSSWNQWAVRRPPITSHTAEPNSSVLHLWVNLPVPSRLNVWGQDLDILSLMASQLCLLAATK